MCWKTKYVRDRMSHTNEVVKVFNDGLVELANPIGINGEVQDYVSVNPNEHTESHIFTFGLNFNELKMEDISSGDIEVLSHKQDRSSFQRITELVCVISKEHDGYLIQFDKRKSRSVCFNSKTLDLIFKKWFEKHLYADEVK
ncbi:hypothetical protein [Rossellomorea sp. DA94]|uniref:hypothetical protein n=1 Tax=Rossellomorea sp. DA94 TaxID=3038653 RepID=UPI00244D3F58|nr:hypothetical protein [Rossellomorea sp. DA94]WGG47676.1 hypothetical protein P8596_10900 [Rossellomorea sp. DA94]